MSYRKIIGFGDGSFVVSLPKDWVTKNGLKKGDTVNVEMDENTIKINSLNVKQTNPNSEINIKFDGDIKILRSKLIYSYIDNYNIINLVGDNLFDHLKDINEITDSLVAFEIIQKSPNKIVFKDFLNIQDISVHDTLRRMDRIIISVAEDIRNYLTNKNITDITKIVEEKEIDVNRLSNLIFKVLKRCFNMNDRAILKLELGDVFYYWELTLFVEKVGDQLKRLIRYIKPGVPDSLIQLFDITMKQYASAMNANFSNNTELALNILTKKREVYDIADKCIKDLPLDSLPSLEKLKNINNYVGNIAKVYLKLAANRKHNL